MGRPNGKCKYMYEISPGLLAAVHRSLNVWSLQRSYVPHTPTKSDFRIQFVDIRLERFISGGYRLNLLPEIFAGQHQRRDEVAPDMWRLKTGEKDPVELVQLLLGQLLRQVRVIDGKFLDIGHLCTPGEALTDADSDRRRHERVDVRTEVGRDPEQVEKQADDDGPLRGQFADQDRCEYARDEHGAVDDCHREDSESGDRVDARLEVLYGTEGGEDEDETQRKDDQVLCVSPLRVGQLVVGFVIGVGGEEVVPPRPFAASSSHCRYRFARLPVAVTSTEARINAGQRIRGGQILQHRMPIRSDSTAASVAQHLVVPDFRSVVVRHDNVHIVSNGRRNRISEFIFIADASSDTQTTDDATSGNFNFLTLLSLFPFPAYHAVDEIDVGGDDDLFFAIVWTSGRMLVTSAPLSGCLRRKHVTGSPRSVQIQIETDVARQIPRRQRHVGLTSGLYNGFTASPPDSDVCCWLHCLTCWLHCLTCWLCCLTYWLLYFTCWLHCFTSWLHCLTSWFWCLLLASLPHLFASLPHLLASLPHLLALLPHLLASLLPLLASLLHLLASLPHLLALQPHVEASLPLWLTSLLHLMTSMPYLMTTLPLPSNPQNKQIPPYVSQLLTITDLDVNVQLGCFINNPVGSVAD